MEKSLPEMASTVLITAGPTREPIDPVRYISNFATGRLGVEIAIEAYNRGYDVTLLYGFGTAEVPEYIKTVRFTTTESLLNKVLKRIDKTDIFISSAAVSDYTPVPVNHKIDSKKDELTIKLNPTPKVIKHAKKASRPGTVFVAFKLGYNLTETEITDQAIKSYGHIAEVLVANDLKKISKNKHEALILFRGNVINKVSTKKEIAVAIFDCIEQNITGKQH